MTEDGEYFNVVVFYLSGRHEYLAADIDAKTAAETFHKAVASAQRVAGAVAMVIITDGGDDTVAQWEARNGLVYPTSDMLARLGDEGET